MKLACFDLDGTLCRSKQPLEPAMAEALGALLQHMPVAVISGCGFDQMIDQFVARLRQDERLSQLHLFPTSGAARYAWAGPVRWMIPRPQPLRAAFHPVKPVLRGWTEMYNDRFTEAECECIEAAFRSVMETFPKAFGPDVLPPSIGPRFERRGAQVTFSALGQDAPLEQKKLWDPLGIKRAGMVGALEVALEWQYEIRAGGTTSVDVTRKGIDKAHAIRQLAAPQVSKAIHLGAMTAPAITLKDMVYYGDRFGPTGNDEVVRQTGIECVEVSGPEQTLVHVRDLVSMIWLGKRGERDIQ